MNVSRETLQSTKFLKQIKQVILKRLLQLFARIEEEEPEKFSQLQKNFGTVLKLGAVEDKKNSKKLALLTRFATNQRNETSFDQVTSIPTLSQPPWLTLLPSSISKIRRKARSRFVCFGLQSSRH